MVKFFFILVNFRQRMYYMPFIATMVHFSNQKENQGQPYLFLET